MDHPWRRPWRCLQPLYFSVPWLFCQKFTFHTLFWFHFFNLLIYWISSLAWMGQQIHWVCLHFIHYFCFEWVSYTSFFTFAGAAEMVSIEQLQVKKNFTLETRSWTEWCRGRALGWWWRLAGCLSTLPLQAAAALALQWRTQNASAAAMEPTRAKIQRHFSLLKLLK